MKRNEERVFATESKIVEGVEYVRIAARALAIELVSAVAVVYALDRASRRVIESTTEAGVE